jgi:superfamily I DNA/RNA helicase
MDRTAEVVHQLHSEMQVNYGSSQPLYDRVYVDEVQDTTQAEIGLLLLAIGGRCDAIFLVGDTAQAIAEGVDFRFEEVRGVVHMISGGRQKVHREKLSRNFRSHEGILSVSNVVLQRLHSAFPNAASKLPPDTGLTRGPRPSLMRITYDELAQLVDTNQKLRVLVRDETKTALQKRLSDIGVAQCTCFGIREAKGLEFDDVLLVNFFSDINIENSIRHKSWKQLLLAPHTVEGGAGALPLGMELELKLLYTAITRSCNRLFFVETCQNSAGEAWFRCLKNGNLASVISPRNNTVAKNVMMTSDDWRAEAIELASLAEDRGANSVSLLETATSHFEKAADSCLMHRASEHLRALRLEQQRDFDGLKNADSAARAVLAYLSVGMLRDAARICEACCTDPSLRQLGQRIKRLMKK